MHFSILWLTYKIFLSKLIFGNLIKTIFGQLFYSSNHTVRRSFFIDADVKKFVFFSPPAVKTSWRQLSRRRTLFFPEQDVSRTGDVFPATNPLPLSHTRAAPSPGRPRGASRAMTMTTRRRRTPPVPFGARKTVFGFPRKPTRRKTSRSRARGTTKN